MSESGARSGLTRGTLSPIEIFGQAIGNTGMATVVAFTPAFVAATAGNAAWLSVLIATLTIFATGYCVSIFARRYASSGSLYTFIAQALGPGLAFLTGWALILAYGGLAVAVPTLGALYLADLATAIDLDLTSTGAQYALFAVLAIAASTFAIRGVRLSTRTALILEGATLIVLVIVLIAVLGQAGTVIDSAQLGLEGASTNDVFLGITLAITAFVGFESGASLGAEAKNPKVAIPRVIMITAAVAGVLYVFATYVEILGFSKIGSPISESLSPIDDLRIYGGVEWLRYPIAAGLALSFFAIILASITALARMLYTMGREGVLPSVFGRAHSRFGTPYAGVLLIAPLVVIVPILMIEVAGADSSTAFTYVATPATFGFMFAYILIAIGAPLLVKRTTGRWDPKSLIAALIAIVAMTGVFVSNFTPTPPEPLNRLPYIFIGAMLIGALVYAAIVARNPGAKAHIGRIEDEGLDDPVLRDG